VKTVRVLMLCFFKFCREDVYLHYLHKQIGRYCATKFTLIVACMRFSNCNFVLFLGSPPPILGIDCDLYFVFVHSRSKSIMPAQKKITGSYSVRKGAYRSASKVTSPSKRSIQGDCILP